MSLYVRPNSINKVTVSKAGSTINAQPQRSFTTVVEPLDIDELIDDGLAMQAELKEIRGVQSSTFLSLDEFIAEQAGE